MSISHSLSLALALGLCLGQATRAHASTCVAPDVLVLFDVSGSMGKASDPSSKYSQAVAALSDVTQNTEADIRYGMLLFPPPSPTAGVFCGPGDIMIAQVPLAQHNWANIFKVISPTLYNSTDANPDFFGGPRWDYDTPMYQALGGVGFVDGMLDPARPHYVLLITDGLQDCFRGGDYDTDPDKIDLDGDGKITDNEFNPPEVAQNRADLVQLVDELWANGVTTFVVGFGGLNIDPDIAAEAATTLNALAVAGGTAPADCVSGCYLRADDEIGLWFALADISLAVFTETCNGLDDDCDGVVDNATNVPCQSVCGSGEEVCTGGVLQACNAARPQPEVCDGVDNNCDGQIDEGCVCQNGATQPCGIAVGDCKRGTQTCQGGAWGACTGEVKPAPEVCDGAHDEDCDGEVDEGCDCTNGQSRDCGSSVGVCTPGTQTCVAGKWPACTGGVQPTSNDPCDGLDNDCDGTVDEFCACTDGTTEACGSSLGTCKPGTRTCVGGAWGECKGALGPKPEVCDNLDNDCSGTVDDGVTCDGAASCRCGTCVAPCGARDSCPDGMVCFEGFCLFESCGAGWHCDGVHCLTGTDGGVIKPPAAPSSGVSKQGCSATTVPGAVTTALGLWLTWLARRRRARA